MLVSSSDPKPVFQSGSPVSVKEPESPVEVPGSGVVPLGIEVSPGIVKPPGIVAPGLLVSSVPVEDPCPLSSDVSEVPGYVMITFKFPSRFLIIL